MKLINETDRVLVLEPGEETIVDQVTVWADDEKTIDRVFVRKLEGNAPGDPPPEGVIAACPGCDNSNIYFRARTRDYRCNACGKEFKDPTYRDKK